MTIKKTRRGFMKSLAVAASLPAVHGYGRTTAPATKPLRTALIGCGNQGIYSHIPALCKERLVALADPDRNQLEKALARIRQVSPETDTAAIRVFSDYRKLFDAMGKELDAVSIAATNHHHALPALLAIRNGLHVYVEKPLTHTVSEGRVLREAARKAGVATQMGNQGQSGEGPSLLREYLEAGAIGPVREVYCWSSKANGLPEDYARPPAHPAPDGLDWDLWVGPAPYRDFHADLHPHTWHSWRDFGNGTLGNMACHTINYAYGALRLGHPTAVEAEEITSCMGECWPVGTRFRWDFPERHGLAPLKLYWLDGLAKGFPCNPATVDPRTKQVLQSHMRNMPDVVREIKRKYDRDLPREGCLLIGERGMIGLDSNGNGLRMIPEEAHRAFPKPAKRVTRVKGSHFRNFFDACRGKLVASSNFEHSVQLSEIVILGNLAAVAGEGRKIEWDGPGMRAVNMPELNSVVAKESRAGWGV